MNNYPFTRWNNGFYLACCILVSVSCRYSQALVTPSVTPFLHNDRYSSRSLQRTTRTKPSFHLFAAPTEEEEEEVDVVIIGAGIGGLSCAALCSRYGLKTLCVEAHDTAGGCAHSFDRYGSVSSKVPFKFDSGPSLLSGVSSKVSTNPLRQVMEAVGVAEDIEWCTYDGWIVHDYADGQSFKITTGDGGEFERALEKKAGLASRKSFEAFKEKMLEKGGSSESSGYIPPFALRGGPMTVFTLAQYGYKFLSIGLRGVLLTGPFTKCMDLYQLTDPFVRKWFDYLAFALSGLDAAHTQAAPVAYTMVDLHKPGAVLDYPMGGMDSLVNALKHGNEKHGGELRLNTRVERMVLEDDGTNAKCTGVVLEGGKIVRARRGVVCNAPLWNMARILEDSTSPTDNKHISPDGPVAKAVSDVRKRADKMEMTGSFMHLHLGIKKDGLPEDLECHHSVLNFDLPIEEEQNMVIISIPTVFDPALAPEGYHIVHAYTAASENFDDWLPFMEANNEPGKVGVNPNKNTASKYNRLDGYKERKDAKAEVLWKAIENVIPDIRERAARKDSVVLVGTPLTHRRYNQRFKGTYGPAPSNGKEVWDLTSACTEIEGLLACGDTTFPGIGLPGVAASGTIAANTLVSVQSQLQLMKELKDKGVLQ